MKLKLFLPAILTILSISFCYANNSMNAPKFESFNPNNQYSFIVYNKGAIVSYDGMVYEARRAIDNNQTPENNQAWKQITLS